MIADDDRGLIGRCFAGDPYPLSNEMRAMFKYHGFREEVRYGWFAGEEVMSVYMLEEPS